MEPIAIPESSNSAVKIHAYSQEVKDFAFVHFVLKDRHVSSAYKSMLESWDQDAWGDPPGRKTVERWAREEDWDYKADVEISQSYPGLYTRDIARLVALRGRAIRAYSRILDGEELKNSMAIAQIAKHTLDLTIGGMPVQAPAGEVAEAGELTVEERTRRQRERLDRKKNR